MKILVISPVPVFPTNTGGRVRIWQISKNLANHFDVSFVFPCDDGSRIPKATELPNRLSVVPIQVEVRSMLRRFLSLCTCWPFHVSLNYSNEISKGVRRLLIYEKISLVYCHFIYSLPYVERVNIPVVLDQQNVDRIYWRRKVAFNQDSPILRVLASINLAKTIRFEKRMLPLVAGIVSVSETDQTHMRRNIQMPRLNFFLAPNGVDTEHYFWKPVRRTDFKPRLVLGFLGSMDLKANQDAVDILCSKIVPEVQQTLADLRVSTVIVGRRPPKSLVDFARERSELNITVTGTVPEVLPFLHEIDIMVLPIRDGAGTKLRVLEAMAAGPCVLGTPLAFEGLPEVVQSGVVLQARTVDDFVSSIVKLARDPEQRSRLSRRARDVVSTYYGWDKIVGDLAAQLSKAFGIPISC